MDPYKLLNVARNATQKDIRKAYLKLAKQLHPDVTGNDQEKAALFKQVNEAHALLSDAGARAGKFHRQIAAARMLWLNETEYSPRSRTRHGTAQDADNPMYGINHDVWYAHHYGIHAQRSARWTSMRNQGYGMHVAHEMYENEMQRIKRQEETHKIKNGYFLRQEARERKRAAETKPPPPPSKDDESCCIS
ncbi:hypothetical protein H310_04438 [Aphanomyces invadans]|uniref:J domain-containing protein n=1 Tax=Aphanomyces invadans TaxID=157072 RepID=A0A024UCW9_9STRA|nr:hypothetical protein H310_04438 [Aphanomyces invadans]ETW04055.1 hypothetical protein H310_04438 [Aphanomyces invadans]|eukprot:XP_008867011.1 hypothetical protein H310_04438 [Aphanomyces invadans]